MAIFITRKFLQHIVQNGQIVDGLATLDALSRQDAAALPPLPKLSSWECVLEEVIDTDHDPLHYARFANELLKRGYSKDDIAQMRLIAWETAGWFNFEMMAWDWCSLSESDMYLGLTNRFEKGDIDRAKHDELKMLIGHYREPPNKSLNGEPALNHDPTRPD